MPKITIEFDRKDDTHEITLQGVSGREMIIAYLTIKENIEEKSNLPIDAVLAMFAMDEGLEND